MNEKAKKKRFSIAFLIRNLELIINLFIKSTANEYQPLERNIFIHTT